VAVHYKLNMDGVLAVQAWKKQQACCCCDLQSMHAQYMAVTCCWNRCASFTACTKHVQSCCAATSSAASATMWNTATGHNSPDFESIVVDIGVGQQLLALADMGNTGN
jgi:hypothetical protein